MLRYLESKFFLAFVVLFTNFLLTGQDYQFSQFNTEQECVDYLTTYDQYVKAGLRLKFPNMKVVDIRCIDIDTAIKMQNEMFKRKEL